MFFFLRVVSTYVAIACSFPLLCSIPLFEYTSLYPFSCWVFFWFEAMANSAAMNILVPTFCGTRAGSASVYIPQSRIILGSKISTC